MAVKHIHGGGGLATDTWVHTLKGNPIAIEVNFKQIEACMKRCREMLPKIRAKSWARAVGTLLKQLKSVMKSGGNPQKGVPKFQKWEDFTRDLVKARATRAGTSQKARIGGVLADENRIVSYMRKSFLSNTAEQVFGWPDSLEKVAILFQDGGDSQSGAALVNPSWRAYIHRLGIASIPRDYTHTPRPVLEPFKDYAVKKIDEWAEAQIHKTMASIIAKESRRAMA